MISARHYEQEAHERTEVAVAGATTEAQADMIREFFFDEASCWEHGFKLEDGDSKSDELGAQNAIQGERSTLMSKALAELQHGDEVNCQCLSQYRRERTSTC